MGTEHTRLLFWALRHPRVFLNSRPVEGDVGTLLAFAYGVACLVLGLVVGQGIA